MVSRREDSGDEGRNEEIERGPIAEDFGHSLMMFGGRLRNVVDIRPLDDYGREMDEPKQCGICGGLNGNHDMRKHREFTSNALDRSISRHPAGKRKPKGE